MNALLTSLANRSQWVRLQTPIGHWAKWHLGHGSKCYVCRAVARFPVLARFVPYSSNGAFFCQEDDCRGIYYVPDGEDSHVYPSPPCPVCGGSTG